MSNREKVIKELEKTEIMLKQAVDRSGEMAAMGAFMCYNYVSDAIALLKEQKTSNLYKCPNCGTWISAENVVRCKDCKHYKRDTCSAGREWHFLHRAIGSVLMGNANQHKPTQKTMRWMCVE